MSYDKQFNSFIRSFLPPNLSQMNENNIIYL